MTMVVLKNYILGCLVVLMITSRIKAQQSFEAGFSLGIMQYEGDIGGRSQPFPAVLFNKTSKSSLSGSIYLSYAPNAYFNIRIAASRGQVQGADSLLPSTTPAAAIKRTRNLHFRSQVNEISLLTAFHFLNMSSRQQVLTNKLSPYLLIGIGLFRFNPMGRYQYPTGESGWVPLKPLRTEGQGMPAYPDIAEYALTALNLQAGLGLGYAVSTRTTLSLEVINRRTNTDYLDDVSGRYIDNTAFDQFFGAGSDQGLMARQMANYPAYRNGGSYFTGFLPGSLRGSVAKKDYYYTFSFKMGFLLGKSAIRSPLWKISHGLMECVQF